MDYVYRKVGNAWVVVAKSQIGEMVIASDLPYGTASSLARSLNNPE